MPGALLHPARGAQAAQLQVQSQPQLQPAPQPQQPLHARARAQPQLHGQPAADPARHNLVPTSAVGEFAESVFSGYGHFNRVQSECFEQVYNSNASVLVCAPTGSGKTGIFELAICRLLKETGGALEPMSVLYFGPIKALCWEMKENFSRKFGPRSVAVGELTGDTAMSGRHVNEPIVCATPEKWDSYSRTWGSQCEATKLVLIDEVHLLNEDRGATLETCVARLRMRMPNTRLIAASATVSNPDDVAKWLGAEPRIFGEEYRPVPLQTHVRGFPPANNDFLFEKRLTPHLSSTIQQYSDGRPTLIFCATRKGAADTAKTLAADSRLFRGLPGHDARLRNLAAAAQSVENQELRGCITSSVGFHSAELSSGDRRLVESLFKSSDLLVVCTTTTLSQGVNLPAHLVIVKSTLQWKGAGTGFQEYSPNMLRQMIGRAGRPQFDTHGTAVILTQNQFLAQYQTLARSQEVIESQIARTLCDAINSEIAGGLIHNVGDLMEWVKRLYLSVRFMANPDYYDTDRSLRKAVGGSGVGSDQLEASLKELCLQYVRELAEHSLVEMDGDGFGLKTTAAGQISCRYYIKFDTMKKMASLDKSATASEIIEALSYAAEFSNVAVRHNEKRQLRELNDKLIFKRPPRAGGWKDTDKKIDCLTQGFLAQDLPQYDKLAFNLKMEARDCAEQLGRILNGLTRFMRTERSWFTPARAAVLLKKGLKVGGWPELGTGGMISEAAQKAGLTPGWMMHLPAGVGVVGRQNLVRSGFDTVYKLKSAHRSAVQSALGRNGAAGSKQATDILACVAKIPDTRLQIEQVQANVSLEGLQLSATVFLQVDVDAAAIAEKHAAWDSGFQFMAGFENGPMVRFEQLGYQSYDHSLQLDVTVPDDIPHDGVLVVSVISEEYIGADVEQRIALRDVFEPSSLPPAPKISPKKPAKTPKRKQKDASASDQPPSRKQKQTISAQRHRTAAYAQPNVSTLLTQFAASHPAAAPCAASRYISSRADLLDQNCAHCLQGCGSSGSGGGGGSDHGGSDHLGVLRRPTVRS